MLRASNPVDHRFGEARTGWEKRPHAAVSPHLGHYHNRILQVPPRTFRHPRPSTSGTYKVLDLGPGLYTWATSKVANATDIRSGVIDSEMDSFGMVAGAELKDEDATPLAFGKGGAKATRSPTCTACSPHYSPHLPPLHPQEHPVITCPTSAESGQYEVT